MQNQAEECLFRIQLNLLDSSLLIAFKGENH